MIFIKVLWPVWTSYCLNAKFGLYSLTKKKGSCLGWINVTPRVDRILFDIDVLPMYFFINFLALLWILIGKSLSTFFTAVLSSSSDRLFHTNYSNREIFHQVLYWNVPYQGFIQISANPHCCIGDWVSIT